MTFVDARALVLARSIAGDAKRLHALEAENAKLKRIVADQMLDMCTLPLNAQTQLEYSSSNRP